MNQNLGIEPSETLLERLGFIHYILTKKPSELSPKNQKLISNNKWESMKILVSGSERGGGGHLPNLSK